MANRPTLVVLALLMSGLVGLGQEATELGGQLDSQFKRAELNPQARVAVLQGIEFLKAKDHKKAISAFAAAAKMHPQSGQFRHLLGVAYYRDQQLGQAWLQFRKAVILNPTYAPSQKDFTVVWSAFEQRGVLAIGRPKEQIAELIGQPDAQNSDPANEIWQYGFMHLQFRQGRLAAIVDPRGIDKQSMAPVDVMKFELDDSARWQLGYRALNRLHSLTEYVPKQQTVRDWKEMVQVQMFLNMAQRSPRTMMEEIEKKLKSSDPSVSFSVLSQAENEVLFHWNRQGSKDRPAEHEIVRLVRGQRDIHRLAYTRRVAQIPQAEAQLWLGLLQKAKLTPATVQSSVPAVE